MRFLIVFTLCVAAVNAAPQLNGLSAGRGGEKYLPPEATTPAPSILKQFYVISAPEEQGNGVKNKHFVLGKPQRNYRVLFIKAPSGDNANVKYSAEFAPQEEKTIIYVLSKKEHELQANDFATPAPLPPSKPEIFFIKYKTEDEAVQAQKEIQNQYNSLGGTEEVAREETAPISSVIGSLNSLNADGSYNYQQVNNGQGGLQQPQQQQLLQAAQQLSQPQLYLPPRI